MTEQELTAIEERCAKATLGPWEYDEIAAPFYNDFEGNSCGGGGTGLYKVFSNVVVEYDGESYEDTIILVEHAFKVDADFITSARVDIPALVAEVWRLRAFIQPIADRMACVNPACGHRHCEQTKQARAVLEEGE